MFRPQLHTLILGLPLFALACTDADEIPDLRSAEGPGADACEHAQSPGDGPGAAHAHHGNDNDDGHDGGSGDDDGDDDGDDHRRVVTALEPLGHYATGVFDEGAAEIVDYHPASERLFVVNGAAEAVDVLELADPNNITLAEQVSILAWGASPNSLAIHGDTLAVAIEAEVRTDPGVVLLLDANTLAYINHLTVGALPDMVTFTPDGETLLVACEGEPSSDYAVDPEGEIAIIDVSGELAALDDQDVAYAGFGEFSPDELDPQVRIFGPGASVAQDLEPEYIAVSADSATAWVTLQENNAIAIVDIASASVTQILALGFKEHAFAGQGLDASDADDAAVIAEWPVFGMYQPDAIASVQIGGQTLLITANEGDARDYEGFSEEIRVKDLALDPQAFPNAAALQSNEQLGRLNVTDRLGDSDDDGEFEQLFAFGGRSVSIWTSTGEQVWDSGDLIEQSTAAALPAAFNSNNSANDSFDGRSDNKGPEPEGVAVASLWGGLYLFVGLERIGGVMVFELSDPMAPELVLYDNSTRDFTGVPEDGTAGDLGPEGLHVIASEDSPIDAPLLVVANEISGTIRVYRIVEH